MTCLVIGATGNVGSLVTERLLDRGERPAVCVLRVPSRMSLHPPGRHRGRRREGAQHAVRERRLATVTDGVSRALGREPVTFGQWVSENAEAFTQSRTTQGN